MKIALLINQFLNTHTGGTEIYVLKLAKGLISAGHYVDIIIPCFAAHKGIIEDFPMIIEGLTIHSFYEPAPLHNREIQLGRKENTGVPNFIKLLETLSPDIVHFHELSVGIGYSSWHLKALKGKKYKIFITMHQAYFTCFSNTMMYHGKPCDGKIRKYECTRCVLETKFNISAIVTGPMSRVANSGVLQLLPSLKTGVFKKLQTFGSLPLLLDRLKNDLEVVVGVCEKLVVLGDWYKRVLMLNGISENKIEVIQSADFESAKYKPFFPASDEDGNLRVVYIGRIVPVKGVHTMIDAVKQLGGKVTLDIYGPDTGEAYVKKIIEQIEPLVNIAYKGYLPNAKVESTLKKYHIFINPSEFAEMSPLSLIDALAAGLIPVVSNAPGNLIYIKNEVNGFVFTMGDVNELKSILNNISKMIFKNKCELPEGFSKVFSPIEKPYLELYNKANTSKGIDT